MVDEGDPTWMDGEVSELHVTEQYLTSFYFIITTFSTVGYGDIVPHTTFGRLLASLLILVGYSLIVVPVTIVTTETQKMKKVKHSKR